MTEVLIDSELTIEEALEGIAIPKEIRETLRIVGVRYLSFDGLEHEGQLVVHESVVSDVQTVFEKLKDSAFPLTSVIPVCVFGWDDDASMAANNSSAFNYRTIFGTERLSNHSHGLAIDINPVQNPYKRIDGSIVPAGASYDPGKPGTITQESEVVAMFMSLGWEWGGIWEEHRKDWQHFEKPFLPAVDNSA